MLLPNSGQSQERFELWSQTNYSAWAEQLKITVVNYCNINHQWQFSSEQQQVLQRYYDANQLLLYCLHSNCEVTAAIRQEIEATLLLPQKELKDRELGIGGINLDYPRQLVLFASSYFF